MGALIVTFDNEGGSHLWSKLGRFLGKTVAFWPIFEIDSDFAQRKKAIDRT